MYIRIDADEVSKKRYGRHVEDLTESEAEELLRVLARMAVNAGARYVRVRIGDKGLAYKLWRLVEEEAWRVYDYVEVAAYDYEEGSLYADGEYARPLAYAVTHYPHLAVRDVLSYLMIVDAYAIDIAAPSLYCVVLTYKYEKSKDGKRHVLAATQN